MTKLELKEVTHKIAKHTCKHWHYSGKTLSESILRLGVWEDGVFKGIIQYSRGSNRNIGKPYGLDIMEVCELSRIALNNHDVPVTKIISESIKILKKRYPRLKLIVSYADSNQGHLGIIYQASSWIFDYESVDTKIRIGNELYHRKTVYDKVGTCSIERLQKAIPDAKLVSMPPKYRYIKPLNKQLRKRLLKLSKPYPKHVKEVRWI